MGKMQRLVLASDTAGAAWVSGWLDVVSSCSSTQSAPRTYVNMQLPPSNSTLMNVMVSIIYFCQEVQNQPKAVHGDMPKPCYDPQGPEFLCS